MNNIRCPYIDPRLVVAPKSRLADLDVIFDGESQDDAAGWSLAAMTWDGNEGMVGIRWNGGKDNPKGNPVSTGQPVWFVLPPEIAALFQKDAAKAHAALDRVHDMIYSTRD